MVHHLPEEILYSSDDGKTVGQCLWDLQRLGLVRELSNQIEIQDQIALGQRILRDDQIWESVVPALLAGDGSILNGQWEIISTNEGIIQGLVRERILSVTGQSVSIPTIKNALMNEARTHFKAAIVRDWWKYKLTRALLKYPDLGA